MAEAKGYKETKWKGLKNYECTRKGCAFSTLDQAEMNQHQWVHGQDVGSVGSVQEKEGGSQ